MRFPDTYVLSLFALWSLRVAGLSDLTDLWPKETFDDTVPNDISFLTVPGVEDDDLFGNDAGDTDSLAFLSDSIEEPNMTENGDISSCEVLLSDDLISGEFLSI